MMLDPKTLTSESLYRLQSETWSQGAEAERERIVKLLETRNQNKTHSEGRYCGLCEAIELIKEEEKE